MLMVEIPSPLAVFFPFSLTSSMNQSTRVLRVFTWFRKFSVVVLIINQDELLRGEGWEAEGRRLEKDRRGNFVFLKGHGLRKSENWLGCFLWLLVDCLLLAHWRACVAWRPVKKTNLFLQFWSVARARVIFKSNLPKKGNCLFSESKVNRRAFPL